MGIRRLIIGLFVVPHLAVAEEAVLSCTGSNPEWTLDYDGSSAQFDFAGRKSDMEVPQEINCFGSGMATRGNSYRATGQCDYPL